MSGISVRQRLCSFSIMRSRAVVSLTGLPTREILKHLKLETACRPPSKLQSQVDFAQDELEEFTPSEPIVRFVITFLQFSK